MTNFTKSVQHGIALAALIGTGAAAQGTGTAKVDSETVSGLGARNIGSAAMSGRVAAVAAVHEGNRLTVYIGAASGGVWKSRNGRHTYKTVLAQDRATAASTSQAAPPTPNGTSAARA